MVTLLYYNIKSYTIIGCWSCYNFCQRQHRALSCKWIFMQKQLSGYKEIHRTETLIYEEEPYLVKNFKVQSNLLNNLILSEDYIMVTNVREPLVYGEDGAVLGKVPGTVLAFRLGWDFCRPRWGTAGIDSGQVFLPTGI